MAATAPRREFVRSAVACLLTFQAALSILPGRLLAAPRRNVLIVRAEAPDLPANRIILDAIQTTLRSTFPGAIEFYVEAIDTARFPSAEYAVRLGNLYAEKYSSLPIDLVVACSEPALEFVMRERARLAPRAPLLAGFVDRRSLDRYAGASLQSAVSVHLDAAETLRLAVRTYPAARRVLVVGGTSEYDRGWMRVVREELHDFDPKLAITYDTESTVEELRSKVAALPSDAVVLFVSMTRDGGGASTRPVDVLKAVRDAASSPIFGMSTTFVGSGIVGGVTLDLEQHGRDIAGHAARLMAGQQPLPMTTPSIAMVDWRELQRFRIAAESLPVGTVVTYRPLGVWEQYQRIIAVVGLFVLGESALLAAMVRLARRRREAQRLLAARLRFEKLVTELSIALTAADSRRIDAALDQGLDRLSAETGIEWVWRWDSGAPEDEGWDRQPLRQGKPALFYSAAELPPQIRTKVPAACETLSAVAVLLGQGEAVRRALFWVSRAPLHAWRVRPEDLAIVGTIVGNVLERRRAESALEQSDRLRGAVLDSLHAQVAVLDRQGTIIAVNDAWTEFGRKNGIAGETTIAPGANYLAPCIAGARAGCEGAVEAAALVEAACRGEAPRKRVEYRCDGPTVERWFIMTAEPLRRPEGGAVVTHWDITERKLSEIAVRESEGRFRRLADALPVAVWMSEVDGACTYFNRQWLEMTGRSLEEEYGTGWLEGVHPDDRARCLETFTDAQHARQRFSIEYRIRQHDGEYRWLVDQGMPRFGADGSFHGYIGGAVDITERREAEQVLRDLSQRLIRAQEEERHRIARELHDHLSQQLALLAIDLQELEAKVPSEDEGLARAVQEAWRRTAEVAGDVHAISHRLHPSKLEALGLVATIRAYCRDVSRQGMAVHFFERDVAAAVPPEVALCLFRVLEEALTNVRNHSGADEATVTLCGEAPGIVLRVSDQGHGIPAARLRSGGLGLVSMRERLQAIGGTLSIDTGPGRGTTIEAHVPGFGWSDGRGAAGSDWRETVDRPRAEST